MTIKLKENGKFNWQWQLILCILWILKKLVLHVPRTITEIMMSNETDEIIEELFEFLLQSYQKDLEESMRGIDFVFYSVDLLHYHLNKISLNRSGSYIDSF